MMQNTVLVPGLSGKDFSAGCESWCSFQQTDAGQMPQIDDSGISIYFLGGFLIDEFKSSTKLLLLVSPMEFSSLLRRTFASCPQKMWRTAVSSPGTLRVGCHCTHGSGMRHQIWI